MNNSANPTPRPHVKRLFLNVRLADAGVVEGEIGRHRYRSVEELHDLAQSLDVPAGVKIEKYSIVDGDGLLVLKNEDYGS